MMKGVSILLASSLLPPGIGNAFGPNISEILRKIETYKGTVDIESADNKIFVFLDSAELSNDAYPGLDIMLILHCDSVPNPWPDMTINEAILSVTDKGALILSHADEVAVGLFLDEANSIVKPELFPGYKIVAYSGYGLARSVQPAGGPGGPKAEQEPVSISHGCFAGGVGSTSCQASSASFGCSISCTAGYYSCCNPSRCSCVKEDSPAIG